MPVATHSKPKSIWKTRYERDVDPSSAFYEASQLQIYRSIDFSYQRHRLEVLDPGVNFYVLMLEQIGCITHYSCEGHPWGFYIEFECPLTVANRIKQTRTFALEYKGGHRWWMSIGGSFAANDSNSAMGPGINLYVLMQWSLIWERVFGPLDLKLVQTIRENPFAYTSGCGPYHPKWQPLYAAIDANNLGLKSWRSKLLTIGKGLPKAQKWMLRAAKTPFS